MRLLRFALTCALCVSLSLPLWSQEASTPSGASDLASLPLFDAGRTYSISGGLLNAWLLASKAQQAALLRAEQHSVDLETTLEVASKAVSESRISFDAYRQRTLATMVAVGLSALLAGYVIGDLAK